MMNWFWKKKEATNQEISQKVRDLSLDVKNLELELALILKKLKFKYKITKRDLKDEEEETETPKYNDGFDELRKMNKANGT